MKFSLKILHFFLLTHTSHVNDVYTLKIIFRIVHYQVARITDVKICDITVIKHHKVSISREDCWREFLFYAFAMASTI